MRLPVVLLCACVLAVPLAGCHGEEGPSEETTLLQRALQLGDTAHHWSDARFVQPDQPGGELRSRTITFNVTINQTIAFVGVKLLGDLEDESSRVTLTLRSANGAAAAQVQARIDGQDYHGTIEGFFYILERLDVPPGSYKAELKGEGPVGNISYTATLVPEQDPDASLREAFDVARHIDRIRLTVSGEGWGTGPTARLVDPDGEATGTVTLTANQDEQQATVDASPGPWHLEVDASGYGGLLTIRVQGLS